MARPRRVPPPAPLARKLDVRPGVRGCVRRAPEAYLGWLAPVPNGVRFQSRMSRTVDVAHVFATRAIALARELPQLRDSLRPDALLWVSWPKRSAGSNSDLSEDGIRALALPLGFVDVKVCAVSERWSGLKLV